MTTSLDRTTSDVTATANRSVAGIVRSEDVHWVGDGFRVSTVLHPGSALAQHLSPFLLMDHHAPYEYEPTDRPAASVPTPTAASRPSRSPSRGPWRTTTAPAAAVSSAPVTSSG